ncbi:unnamed protein product, partial [Aphanomyces euteiches]
MRSFVPILLAAVSAFHPGVLVCDTWRAWKCFDDLQTPVRWSSNGYDIECLSVDGKTCMETLSVPACLQLKAQPPSVTHNIVCSSKTNDWCTKAKERLDQLDQLTRPTTPASTKPSPSVKPSTTASPYAPTPAYPSPSQPVPSVSTTKPAPSSPSPKPANPYQPNPSPSKSSPSKSTPPSPAPYKPSTSKPNQPSQKPYQR